MTVAFAAQTIVLSRRPGHSPRSGADDLAPGGAGKRRPRLVRTRGLRRRGRSRQSPAPRRTAQSVAADAARRHPHAARRRRASSRRGSLARVTLDVAPATPHSVTQDGNRLVVRFDADVLDAASRRRRAGPGSEHPRRGYAATIVLDLGPRFASFRAADQSGDRGATRIVIEVVAQTTAAPRRATRPPVPPPTPEGAAAARTASRRRPAHHRDRRRARRRGSGRARARRARSRRTSRLRVARRLKAALEARLGVRVLLTREAIARRARSARSARQQQQGRPVHQPARQRVGAAGASPARKCSTWPRRLRRGRRTRRARRRAKRCRSSAAAAATSRSSPWEIAQARHLEQSAALARASKRALRERVPMSPRALQQAPFRVLRRRQHAGGAGRDGLPDQRRSRNSSCRPTSIQNAVVAGAARRHRRDSATGDRRTR